MLQARSNWLWIIIIVVFLSSFGFAQDKLPVDQAVTEKLVIALVAAKTEEERETLLTANKELITAELEQALLKEGSNYFNEGNYAQALTIYYLAQNIAEQIDDKPGIARTLNRI